MNKYIKYSFVAVVILVVGFGVYYGMNNYTQPAVEKATEVYTCSMHPEIIRRTWKLPDMWNEFKKSD
jgi:Cu(I)/Ag(I) efflux system membrane fusion protein